MNGGLVPLSANKEEDLLGFHLGRKEWADTLASNYIMSKLNRIINEENNS